jgi:hypothetical protein
MQGPGGMQSERKILAQFDADKDGRLNATERREAGPGSKVSLRKDRAWVAAAVREAVAGSGLAARWRAARRGPEVSAADVKKYGAESLYDQSVLRTLFFQFENDDWEKEMMAFNNTDVEVPRR